MAEITEKREIELLTLRLLALTAENEILVRNAIGNANNAVQLKDAKELLQLQTKYKELQSENEELQRKCEILQSKLNEANEKYRIITSQVDTYKEQIKALEDSNIRGKLKFAAKKLLNKNGNSEGENK